MPLAAKFLHLFAGLQKAHGESIPLPSKPGEKVKSKNRTVSEPPTEALWQDHLDGVKGLGIIAITEDSICTWGAIDIDVYDLNLVALEKNIRDMELPFLVCRTKSGGAHLYSFFSEPIAAKLVRGALNEFASILGYPGSEVFPKQEVLGQDSTGNWINMPYFKAEMTTRYCIHGGSAVSGERFVDLCVASMINADALGKIRPRKLVQSALVQPTIDDDDFLDAPPCLQQLVQKGFPQGSKNNALFSLGVYARRKWPDHWEERVVEYNARYMSGTNAEVQGIIKSLSKKIYEYKCKDIPLFNECQRIECFKRQYGLSKKTSRDEKDALPCLLDDVDRPVKVYRPENGSGDEPQWVFCIAGEKLDVTLDMIMDQNKFLREYTKKFERVMVPVALPRWSSDLNELLAEAEPDELPSDAGPEGRLMQLLEGFLTGKVKGLVKSELLTGRPWTGDVHGDELKEGKEPYTWFRSQDFYKYCQQQHFNALKEKEYFAIFRRRGGKNRKFMLKGKCVGVWGFPSFTEQTEELEQVVIPMDNDSGEKEDLPF